MRRPTAPCRVCVCVRVCTCTCDPDPEWVWTPKWNGSVQGMINFAGPLGPHSGVPMFEHEQIRTDMISDMDTDEKGATPR